MSETFDLSIHLGPGVAQLCKNKSGQYTEKDNPDDDCETGELTAKPKAR